MTGCGPALQWDMVTTRRSTVILAAALAALLVPAASYADLRATAFGGYARINETNKGTFGASVALGGLIGLEAEAARTPLGLLDNIDIVDVDTDITTYMVNLVLRAPIGRVQPYGSAGVGVVRASGSVTIPGVGRVIEANASDVGWNLGGGLYLFPSDHLGIRGDLRRFQTGDVTWKNIGSLGDLPLPTFDFWRASVGVTVKF